MSEEIWRSLQGIVPHGDNYEISNLGNLKNIKTEQNLSPTISTTGYRTTYLCLKGSKKIYKVHRLVALAFLPQIEGKPDVNHKSGDKLDNRLCNLEWASRQENIIHAYRIGLIPYENSVKAGKGWRESEWFPPGKTSQSILFKW